MDGDQEHLRSVQEPGDCSLIALPDSCLLEVLQLCAADGLRSLFSVARAHSKLRQAAAAVLSSITADLSQQKQMDGVLRYLENHSRYVNSIDLRSSSQSAVLQQLPPSLQLSSLQLNGLRLQLLPGEGFQGVLGAAAAVAALKQLRLRRCKLIDSDKGLAAALSSVAAVLEHFSFDHVRFQESPVFRLFPTAVLQQMQQLTYLKLARTSVHGPGGANSVLQPLEALTRLVDLRLDRPGEGGDAPTVSDSMLSGMQLLTRIGFTQVVLDPGALAGKPKLQHLQLITSYTTGAVADGVGELLSQLQHLTNLTHLNVIDSLTAYIPEWGNPADDGSDSHQEQVNPPAAAYAALTASSKLQYLDLSDCSLPVGAWQHIFPAGKQLPHLQTLLLSSVSRPSGLSQSAPDGLVSCCPALQVLDIGSLRRSVQLLAPLQGLSALHTLRLAPSSSDPDDLAEAEGYVAASQLTRLRDLTLHSRYTAATREGLLRPLTQLQQLTRLKYGGARSYIPHKDFTFTTGEPGAEPVWRQLQLWIDAAVDTDDEEASSSDLGDQGLPDLIPIDADDLSDDFFSIDGDSLDNSEEDD